MSRRSRHFLPRNRLEGDFRLIFPLTTFSFFFPFGEIVESFTDLKDRHVTSTCNRQLCSHWRLRIFLLKKGKEGGKAMNGLLAPVHRPFFFLENNFFLCVCVCASLPSALLLSLIGNLGAGENVSPISAHGTHDFVCWIEWMARRRTSPDLLFCCGFFFSLSKKKKSHWIEFLFDSVGRKNMLAPHHYPKKFVVIDGAEGRGRCRFTFAPVLFQRKNSGI